VVARRCFILEQACLGGPEFASPPADMKQRQPAQAVLLDEGLAIGILLRPEPGVMQS
jgi:hypothetical protein